MPPVKGMPEIANRVAPVRASWIVHLVHLASPRSCIVHLLLALSVHRCFEKPVHRCFEIPVHRARMHESPTYNPNYA
jgi:hypothetical protein